ncbi:MULTISPECIES: OmpA family protein [Pseudomonas]|uniref:OmpA family protein n=1 Tax=Pseudomonas TaxID=286 RepID=UPI001BEB38E5|nr:MULTISPECIES: OmpA family protein [Pseudomonas]MBT2337754.1 OmpA family protein [Pseudomonas fluorescens]MCD4532107.1 OmpA family protein [Pseudomonas sp. C3-2018]
MTTKLQRALWLWAGTLVLTLIAIIPLAAPGRIVAALLVVCGVALAWIVVNRRASVQLTVEANLPPVSFRRRVVLVCGDGLDGLFGTDRKERVTDQACYLRVPEPDQLPDITETLLASRPGWGAQLSVMFIVNPAAHTDQGVLAGRLRTFRHQAALARRHGTALPLMLVSYVRTLQGEAPWFCWANGDVSPRVRDAGACVSLTDWQLQAADSSSQAARMQASVQLRSVTTWLHEMVFPHLMPRDGPGAAGSATIFAIKQVPALPQVLDENLWRQWLRNKVALVDKARAVPDATLPFPDPLLNLIPLRVRSTPAQRASVIALWLFALTGAVALASSARQNTLLVRQVSDDLRRHASIPEAGLSRQREDAVAALRQTAQRLDTYYRHGAPLALGLGLCRGEPLRGQLSTLLGHYPEPSVPALVSAPEPARLDSLSLFSPGSAQLKPDSTKVLVSALVGIKAQPGWLIVIAGHTDATGDELQNLRLSRARAAAVHDWMQHMGGIPDSCMAVQGFGASQPIASNDTEAGRAANRRVDIRLVREVGACTSPAAEPDRQPPVASRGF